MLTAAVGDLDHLDRGQVGGVQHDQRVRQVIADQHVAIVGGYRRIAGVDTGTHLGDLLQPVQVVLGDPAVA